MLRKERHQYDQPGAFTSQVDRGKFYSASRILAAFPSTQTYHEPCGGVAHVLMLKPNWGHREVYNDLNDDLCNFLAPTAKQPRGADETVRTPAGQLQTLLRFSPEAVRWERA